MTTYKISTQHIKFCLLGHEYCNHKEIIGIKGPLVWIKTEPSSHNFKVLYLSRGIHFTGGVLSLNSYKTETKLDIFPERLCTDNFNSVPRFISGC